MLSSRRFFPLIAGAIGLTCLLQPVRAVLFISTADPTFNTSAPTGSLAGSGWQYEAAFGGLLATAVGPHHFLTVKHIGIPSNSFVYQGTTYNITGYYDDPGSDLRLFVVAETIPAFAPLYTRKDEVGQSLVVIGRGTQRGDPVYMGGNVVGWQWGNADQVQRWGENRVASANGVFLYATFDQSVGVNEAHLSSGDSGGAVFINDAGSWKLAGINYGVDGPFAYVAGAATFQAALFDTRNLFNATSGAVASGVTPVPSGFYSIRTSTEIAWLYSIVFPGVPVPDATPTPTPTPTPSSTPSPTPSATPAIAAQMIAPVPGTTLNSSSAVFSWTENKSGTYSLWIGTAAGSYNLYNSGRTSTRSIQVSNLPTNGTTIYVRLRSFVSTGNWQYNSYTYKTSGAAPTPTPTATPGSSATPTPSATATPNPHPRPTPPEGRL